MISKRIHGLALWLLAATAVFAQTQSGTESMVPSFVKYAGILADSNGRPIEGSVEVTFSLYKEPQGGAALWMESQKVQVDSLGNYAVILGSTTMQGVPASLFVAGEARWLGVQIAGQAEQPRVMLLAVPYAMKAGDAATLGGMPPSAFMMVRPAADGASPASPSPVAPGPTSDTIPPSASNVTTTGGTVNAIPLFTTATNIQNSILTQSAATAINVAGKLNLPANGTATATAGKNSRPQDFVASAFNSSSAAAVAQTFQLQAEAGGNNTAAPFGTLNLLYGSGTTAPAETGFKINNKGLITFATGQTFPGTGKGTITGVTSGTGLTGGGTTGTVTLNLDTTKVPELITNNTFSGTEQFKGNVGVGTPPSGNGYTPLSVSGATNFGTWLALANTSTGGHTWNIISAGSGNAEGAGNLGITDLTGTSTIWLEGNSRTNTLTATGSVVGTTVTGTGSVGGPTVEADINGANNTTPTPGLRFGGTSSGETIASNRNVGLNRYGLDFYTEFAPRVSITQSGLVGIATKVPRNQLEVISQSTQYVGVNSVGAAAASGSNEDGGHGMQAYGGDSDGSGNAGNGFVGWGGNGGYGGVGGFFTAGSGNGETQSAVWTQPGSGSDPTHSGAGFFNGNILVNGGVTSAAISRIIDDPIDPGNKYIYHSSVESPDMKNIYDGVVSLDATGEATVVMPEWFGALNRDFRYQLTCVGGFAPIYIAEELANNEFKISGGRAGMKVSWQVTGIRQDAWANAHRTPVEVDKNERERGFYLAPELFGAPAEKSVVWARHPEMMKRLQNMRKKSMQAAPVAGATRTIGSMSEAH